MKPFVLSGTFGSGFSMALMAKDIETADDLSDSLGVTADGIAASARLWRKASDASGPGADHTAIFNYLLAAAPARHELEERGAFDPAHSR
jgi:3-hydroxyisobutyrate dehydrogenase